MNSCFQDPPSRDSGSNHSNSLPQLQSLDGYEYDFDPPVDSRYECPICLLVLREPSQTKCGHRFCRECILRTLKNISLRCPIDNEPLTEADIYPDNYAKREILNCNIKCPNKDDGCEKVFPLCELKAHLQECQYTLVPCPNKCGSILPQRDIEEHVGKYCGLRIVMCTCCGASMHAQLTQKHVMICPKVQVKCEHCHKEMNREMIKHHLQTACEHVTVLCPFYPLGCGSSMKRWRENNHLMEEGPNHLRQLCGAVTHILAQMNSHQRCVEQGGQSSDLPQRSMTGMMPESGQRPAHLSHNSGSISGLNQAGMRVMNGNNNRQVHPSQMSPEVQYPSSTGVVCLPEDMKSSMENLEAAVGPHQTPSTQNHHHPLSLPSNAVGTKMVQKTEGRSLPFLGQTPCRNLADTSSTSHLNVPVTFSVTSSIDTLAATTANLNLQSPSVQPQGRLQEERMTPASSPSQSALAVLESAQHSDADAARTIPLIFSMMEQFTATFDQKIEASNKEIAELKSTVSNLKKQNTELSQVVLDLQALVSSSLSKICCGKFYWTIQGFSVYKQRALKGEMVTLHSQPFYTSTWGYKMCLRANITSPQKRSNGSTVQQHLSLFVHVMQGDNDAILPWPFTGKIMLALLDQNKEYSLQKHVQETLEAKPNLAAFQRPLLPRNQKGFGFIEFMPVTAIEGGTYLLNDCLVVYAQVYSHAG